MIQYQIATFEEKANAVSRRMSDNLRAARNFAILTPFQKTTRERIAGSIPALASRIRHDRLQLIRYQTYIAILHGDHKREQRELAVLRVAAPQLITRTSEQIGSVESAADPNLTVLHTAQSHDFPLPGVISSQQALHTSDTSVLLDKVYKDEDVAYQPASAVESHSNISQIRMPKQRGISPILSSESEPDQLEMVASFSGSAVKSSDHNEGIIDLGAGIRDSYDGIQ